MSARALKVLLAGRVAGTLEQRESGKLSFEYERDYQGAPLSLSMPVSNRVYGDKRVRPFLFGLLPDDAAVRQSMGREFGVSGNNPFALLEHVGLECPGAVRFCLDEAVEETLMGRFGGLEPITEHEIARRLKQGRERFEASWMDEREHWSLGGQQSKFALRFKDGAWFRCLGAAATTHILKPGIGHLSFRALNECACMRTASACGVATANVEYRFFGDEPAIVVERYDRVVDERSEVVRLHQEDFCQILNVLPENKYAEYGGPSASAVLDVLGKTGAYANANVQRFVEMLFFNYLIGAPDAHAKNYSVLLGMEGQAVLAPLYDVASAFPYRLPKERIKVAMSVGGENLVGKLGPHHVRRFVEANELEKFGLDGDACIEILARLAKSIPGELGRALDGLANCEGADELNHRLLKPVERLCSATLAKL